MNAGRDAAAVVDNANDIARFDKDFNMRTGAGQRFINGVVDDFIHQMMQAAQAGGGDIHAGALAHCLKSFENLNLIFIVSLL